MRTTLLTALATLAAPAFARPVAAQTASAVAADDSSGRPDTAARAYRLAAADAPAPRAGLDPRGAYAHDAGGPAAASASAGAQAAAGPAGPAGRNGAGAPAFFGDSLHAASPPRWLAPPGPVGGLVADAAVFAPGSGLSESEWGGLYPVGTGAGALSDFGDPAGARAVPEPGCVLLAAGGALGLAARLRRRLATA